MAEDKERKEEEAFELEDLVVEEISLVDVPAVPDAEFVVFKRDSESAEEEEDNEAEPNSETEVDKKQGKEDEEQEEEEQQKKDGYLPGPKQIIEGLKAILAQEKDEKRRKRLELVIANLQSFFNVKKVGRAISTANAAKLKQIAATLMDAAKTLMEIAGEKPYGYGYGYGYEYYGYTTNTQKSASSDQESQLLTELASVILSGKKMSKEELSAIEQALKLITEEGDTNGNGGN